jgi:hypothetical protein
LGFPVIYYFAVKLGHWWAKTKKQNGVVSVKDMFIRYSYTLVPLGLLAWVAFSLPLIMVNGSYILSVLSDPLGRGWNFFGTAHITWTPVYPEYATYIQVALLLVGLYYGIQKAWRLPVSCGEMKKQPFAAWFQSSFCLSSSQLPS